MARRVSLPKADDLFRPTTEPAERAESTESARAGSAPQAAKTSKAAAASTSAAAAKASRTAQTAVSVDVPAEKKPSGRVKHDAKMTVYITDDELMDIEHARLSLRRSEGIIIDRGRLVREAVAIVLAELEAKGPKSALVKRLRED